MRLEGYQIREELSQAEKKKKKKKGLWELFVI